ncbi:MAG TPA: type II toxin-antitoxin system prevent-host-death family antitoxin [Polyangia bacterium]|nr:type II toxin-antitoxin system prevent-host-death family antitoxin [Polyangia bacterium]
MTQRIPTAAARKGFANVLRDSAKGERIKLTRYNKTVAVIIPKKDLVDLEECEKQRTPSGNGESAEAARAHTHKHGKADK